MINIAVIDENVKVRSQLVEQLETLLHEADAEIHAFADISAFVEDITLRKYHIVINNADNCMKSCEEVIASIPGIVNTVRIREERIRNKFLIIGNQSEQIKAYYDDIICIEKVKGTKYVDYVMKTETLRDRKTLEQVMEDAVYHDFIMVEKGHAVNMKYVVSMIGKVITLSNGAELIVSRTRMRDVRNALNAFWRVKE